MEQAYSSFSYLDESQYESYELPELDHVGDPFEIPLSAEEERTASNFLDSHLIISLHEHPVYQPRDVYERGGYVKQGRVVTPYHLLKEGPLDMAFVGLIGVHTWDDLITNLGMRRCDYAHQDFVRVIEDLDDIAALNSTNTFGAAFGVETTGVIGHDIDRLDVLYGLGLRTIGLTYDESNAVGTGGGDQENDQGLTDFGEQAIERMNDLGLLIDASHASDQTTLDAARHSEDPIILSHNGAQGILDIDRLDPDDVLHAVAENSGLIGIQAAPHNTASPDHPTHSIYSYMDHFEYLVDLVGIDHVTFGPDLSWGDHVELHRYFDKDLDKYPSWVDLDIDYVEGMENPNEAWRNIVRWLVSNGYSEDEIGKVTAGNTLRVLEAVW